MELTFARDHKSSEFLWIFIQLHLPRNLMWGLEWWRSWSWLCLCRQSIPWFPSWSTCQCVSSGSAHGSLEWSWVLDLVSLEYRKWVSYRGSLTSWQLSISTIHPGVVRWIGGGPPGSWNASSRLDPASWDEFCAKSSWPGPGRICWCLGHPGACGECWYFFEFIWNLEVGSLLDVISGKSLPLHFWKAAVDVLAYR